MPKREEIQGGKGGSFNDFVMYLRCLTLSNEILHFLLFLLSKLTLPNWRFEAKLFCIGGKVGCTFAELFPAPKLFPPVDFKLPFWQIMIW